MATVVNEVQSNNEEVRLDKSEASDGKSFIDNIEPDDETEKEGDENGKESEKDEESEKGKEVTDDGKTKEEPVLDEKDEEIRNLRQISRDQKRELDKVTQALERTNKLLKEANLIPPEEEEKNKAIEEFRARREEQLENLLEIMRVSDRYGDVDEVVSQEHFDDMVEAMARAYIAEYGGKLEDVIKGVEAEIWATRNPYKLMYDNIKRYHPDYRTASTDKSEEGKVAGKDGKGRTREGLDAKKIASSIHELGGGSSSGDGGWTAAKIDELDELELDRVPKDVYDKYLRGELK